LSGRREEKGRLLKEGKDCGVLERNGKGGKPTRENKAKSWEGGERMKI